MGWGAPTFPEGLGWWKESTGLDVRSSHSWDLVESSPLIKNLPNDIQKSQFLNLLTMLHFVIILPWLVQGLKCVRSVVSFLHKEVMAQVSR